MCDTTTPSITRDELAAWLNNHNERQRDLAAKLDEIVSRHWHASCMTGEGDMVYDLLVGHLNMKQRPDAVLDKDADLFDEAIALMRELGGTWGGEGCLDHAGFLYQHALRELDDPDSWMSPEDYGHLDAATWFTLEEMAARTGQPLPAA